MTPAERSNEAAVMAPVYRRGDRTMLAMLGLHLVAAVCFAVFYDTWFEAWSVGGIAVGIFVVSMLLLPGSATTRWVSGVALQAFVALHIYQLHGLAEMHFFFFTAFAAMIVYQDWRCMWPGALLIIAQHILFAVLHNQGVTVYFFEGDYIGLTKLGFHFGIAAFHVGLCNLWAILLKRQTLLDARIRADLSEAQAQAERISTAKTDFLGNMSHELRTPMAGVVGMTDLMLEQGGLDPQQRESLELVRNSARAVVDIVNDALDLARVESGRLELAHTPVHLRRLAEEVVELLQPRADQRRVELALRWAPGGPAIVLGDEGRWRQILLNLVGNAIKFAAGSYVLLDIEVRPAAAGADTAFVVRVEDGGAGIDAAVLPRLFRKFEQGGAATFSAFGGSGLGLAICKELTALMGLQLSVHSVLGAGTTFVVSGRLTVAEAAEATPHIAVRALLLGDREITMAVIAEQLEAMGASVAIAHDAAAARRLVIAAEARGTPFTLLFTDPKAMADLEATNRHLRVVMLGRDDLDTPGERMVWLNRHEELRRVVGTPTPLRTARTAELPQLGLHMLLVDDDAVCTRVEKRMLERLGCSVVCAQNGAEALALHAKADFDAILMDCRMPVMDGLQATAAIRRSEPTGTRKPILALSANSLPADRAEFARAGADLFLTKPVGLQELAKALTDVAARLVGPAKRC